MKRSLLFVCLLIFISCNDKKNDQQQNNVPEALQDDNKTSGVSLVSKHSYDDSRDLVDELYKEKLEKTPALLTIDKLHKELKENKPDSLDVFDNYVQKNDQYYKSADFRLRRILDSLLRKEIENILSNSINQFTAKTGRLTALKDALSRAELSADDRYEAVKVLVTLRMMALYQDNLPSSKPIESMLGSYNDLNKKMDSVISKNK